MANTYQFNFLIALVGLLVLSCKDKDHGYHNLIDKIEAESVEFSRDSLYERETYDHEQLIDLYENDRSFYIQNRKTKMVSYACSECHTQSVDKLKTEGLGKKAHWDVVLNHANDHTMSCLTCHVENDMDQLQSNTGHIIDFNYSYQLCSQCHSKEVKDWIGGAHGKNLSGWKGARVAKLCVECHNPHQPAIAKRWPSRYNSNMANSRN